MALADKCSIKTVESGLLQVIDEDDGSHVGYVWADHEVEIDLTSYFRSITIKPYPTDE